MSEPSSAGSQVKAGLFSELRRRRVLRTLALYVVGAWGLVQIADVVFPALGLAEESIRYLLFLSIAGFPVALVFGWLFDISSDGIHRTAPASAEELAARVPLRAPDYLILFSLLLVLGLIGYGVLQNAENIPLPTASDAEPVDFSDWERDDGPPMIGVLPFAHLGNSEDGEFFATGVHDDLLTSLSKISALRIISRTSVLQYAGTTKAIPEIGRELRADAILEGGVRVAGNQIRINAQLIDARSDEHLWAETYDRELTANNIFSVQSEIARAISSALQTTLTADESANLALIPTSNLAAYRAFHETMQWRDTIHLSDSTRPQFVEGLEKAFALDPTFTRPMVELVGALALKMFRTPDKEDIQRVEELIDRIGEIAPNSVDHYTAQSFYFYYVLEDYARANGLIEKAQELSPSDPRLLNIQSWIQRRDSDWEGWLASTVAAYKLAPRDEGLGRLLARRLAIMHRYDEAREVAANLGDDPYLGVLRGKLAFARHQDLQRLQTEIEADLDAVSSDAKASMYVYWSLWKVQTAQHRNSQARETLQRLAAAATAVGLGEGSPGFLSPILETELLQAVVLGDPLSIRDALSSAKRALELATQRPEAYLDSLDPMLGSLLAVAEGRQDLAVKKLSVLWKDPELDRALWLRRNEACQGLGLAAAARETVDCLRNSLEEPSVAMHFYEPHLAFYDPVRESPEFRGLVQELSAKGWLKAQN